MKEELFPLEKAILDKTRDVPRSLLNKPIKELEEI